MNIGIDIEEICKFAPQAPIRKQINKIFSSDEIEYIKSKENAPQTITGMYCAKEAYFKATGTGIIKSKLTEVEIVHDANGKPYYKNDSNAALSISHTKTAAVAVCILQ
jgi:phosphopantetheine--protein transferase-like protein